MAGAAAMLSCSAKVMGCTSVLLAPSRPPADVCTPSVCTTSMVTLRSRHNVSRKARSLGFSANHQSCRSGLRVVTSVVKGEGSPSNLHEQVTQVASEQAVEGPFEVQETARQKTNGSPEVLKAQADRASDEASLDQSLRHSVVDVASDTAVDNQSDVDALAKKDAEGGIADILGLTVEDTTQVIEEKAEETSDREAIIAGVPERLSEGMDARRPSLEEITEGISESVREGIEGLKWGAEGVAESGGYARQGMDTAREAIDKRLKGISIAAEEARETGSKAAEIAAKGWEELAKRTEGLQEGVAQLVDQFQKKVEDAQKNLAESQESSNVNAQNGISRGGESTSGDTSSTVSQSVSADAVAKMTEGFEQEHGNEILQSVDENSEPDASSLLQSSDPVEKDDEWGVGKK